MSKQTPEPVSKDDASEDPQWLSQLKQQTRKTRRRAFIVSLFINTFAMVTSIFVLQVYDKVVYLRGLDTLVALVIGMMVILAFDFVLRTVRSDLMRSVATHVDAHGTSQLFRHIMSLPLRALEARPTEFWNSLFRDLSQVRNSLSGPSAVAQMDFPFAFLMLGLIFIIARPVFLVPVFFTVIILALLWRSEKVLQKRVAAEALTHRKRQGDLFDIVLARVTIKSNQMQEAAFERWAERQSAVMDSSIDRGTSNDFYETASHTVSQLSSVTLIAVGAVAIIDGQMTIGGLIAANILSGRAIGTMARLISHWRGYRESKEAQTRLTDVYAIEAEKTTSPIDMPKPKGNLRLENVGFTYPDQKKAAIDKVSVMMDHGGIIGVIGANGSGKTTLLKLVRGLYRPLEGRVLLDGNDLTQFGQKELSKWIGYLPQESALVTGSFLDNIVFGLDPRPSDREIITAATLAGCHKNIVDMPQGYSEVIVNNGANISPGLKQKVALARVLVRDSAMVLMDEPTNHLDNASLNHLIQTLTNMKQHKTIIVVSHHIALLNACDNIVMMDDGAMVRSGNAQRILTSLGYAQNPAQTQAQTQAQAPTPIQNKAPTKAPAQMPTQTPAQTPAPAKTQAKARVKKSASKSASKQTRTKPKNNA